MTRNATSNRDVREALERTLPHILRDVAATDAHPLTVAGHHLAQVGDRTVVRLAAAAAATYRRWLLPNGWALDGPDEHGLWWHRPRQRLLDVPLLCSSTDRPSHAALNDVVRTATQVPLGPRTRLHTVRLLALRGPAASLVTDALDTDAPHALRPLRLDLPGAPR